MVTKTGRDTRESLGGGLYRRTRSGKTFYELRYTVNGKRRFTALKSTKLTIARVEASKLVTRIAEEDHDPVAEKRRQGVSRYKTMDDVAGYWKAQNGKRLRHPNVPNRRYDNHIAPFIGQIAIDKITSADVVAILVRLEATPSAANKVLIDLKQLFSAAVKLGLVRSNFLREFNPSDAGGKEQARERSLSLVEIGHAMHSLRRHPERFTRDNYLMLALLFCLGVRKSELAQAQWAEFDLASGEWRIPKERTKTGEPITIPLAPAVVDWLRELHTRAFGSDYVFPNRRAGSSGRRHMGGDTLNRALAAMFGKAQGTSHRKPENVMGDLKPFVPHDCRRTTRTLLSELGVAPHIAERCLNHKLKGVMAVYDKHDFLKERRDALAKLTERVAPLVNGESNVVELPNHG
ncbi:site-specific integrase [Pseudomaricurvus alcaniphilus]|uniref:tyrosine-type recombinase/integrase n=1 Tax=Pseudomaricurvus alcaniphilus TaxID=1166482 RepID=UPI00140887B0|nr:tyrosine-type recombinase/integrase [Pseudomaricurvus alcaniphilus]NHN38628.1 site-specific integrase [Pseudomaricurvus alcaniphilus]